MYPGVSIKFEVGSHFKSSSRLYQQGAAGPESSGSSARSGTSEMRFPVFWAPN